MNRAKVFLLFVTLGAGCVFLFGCGEKEERVVASWAEKFLPGDGDIESWQLAEISMSDAANLPKTIANKDNLSRYGLVKLCNAKYKHPSGGSVSVKLCDMGSMENSFGVWTAIDRMELERACEGIAGSMSDAEMDFYRGKYFVSICAGSRLEPASAAEAIKAFGLWINSRIDEKAEMPRIADLLPQGYVEGSMKYFINLETFPVVDELDGEDPLNLASGAKGAMAGYTLVTKNTDSGEVKTAQDQVFVVEYPVNEGQTLARKAFEKYIEFFNRKKEGYSIVGLFNEPIRILVHKEGKLNSIIYQYGNHIIGAWNLHDTAKREAVIKALLRNLKTASAAKSSAGAQKSTGS